MTYTNFPCNKENDISDFLDKVYDNFKNVIQRLKTKPEYLNIFAGETNAVASSKQPIGGGYVICDNNPTVYGDGSIHVNNDQSDVNLQKAVKTLIEKLQKAYPDIPQSTLKSMVNESVKKAVTNIANKNYNEIPKDFNISNTTTYATTVANLALFYFEQLLYNTALNNDSLLSGNIPEEQNTINVTEEDEAKWKKSNDSIKAMLDDIFDSNYINGFLTQNECNGSHWLEMDVDTNNKMNFSDLATQKAYDKFFEQMISKSGFKNSGLTETEFKQIYNMAWIDVYNKYKENNQEYNLNDILNTVVNNLKKILNRLTINPEYSVFIQNDSAMTQKSSDKREISYENTDIKRDYGDNNVHLSDNESDKIYQDAVNSLRTKLKGKYVPPLSEFQFDSWFKQAQEEAWYACMENSRDITKGLQVKDGTRHGDGCNIQIDQITELICYKFDKLILKNLF